MIACRVIARPGNSECPEINRAHAKTYAINAINAIWYCVVAQHLRRSLRIIYCKRFVDAPQSAVANRLRWIVSGQLRCVWRRELNQFNG